VVGRCPRRMKRTKMRNSSVGGLPPLPWLKVEGGWGELYCSQNVKRSFPITVKQRLSQKGHGRRG
jgi:hypothetical protein